MTALIRVGYSVRGLANWILDHASVVNASLTNMSLNKLLFFSIEDALLEHGRLLTNAKIEAWEHGPVFREVYHDFKRYGDKPILGRSSFYSIERGDFEEVSIDLDPRDAEQMRCTMDRLIHRSAAELRGISHVREGAWHRVWWYNGHANPGMEIIPELIVEAGRQR